MRTISITYCKVEFHLIQFIPPLIYYYQTIWDKPLITLAPKDFHLYVKRNHIHYAYETSGLSILKQTQPYKAKTTKGKSLPFLLFIFFGYICGITGKLMAPTFKWYVLFFYVLNFIMVGADLVLYIRNYRFDKLAESK